MSFFIGLFFQPCSHNLLFQIETHTEVDVLDEGTQEFLACMLFILFFGSILYRSLCGLDVEWLISYIDRTEAQLGLPEKL